MAKIVTVAQMQAIERAAAERGHSYAAMMQAAGRAVADRVRELVRDQSQPRIAILVGPGNNGGDGLVAARILKEEHDAATVGAYLLKPRPDDDTVFAAAQTAGVFIASAADDAAMGYRVLHNLVANADVVVDALFGFGLRLPITGEAATLLQQARRAINQRHSSRASHTYTTPTGTTETRTRGPVILAVDCPSGVDCDTGALDSNTLTAHETITFAAAKPGLLIFPGAAAVGRLHIGSIDLPSRLPQRDDIPLTLVESGDVAQRLPERPRNSHKGTFGKALILGGSPNYFGAPYLAARAAYRSGAGLVTVAATQAVVPTLASMIAEATWLPLPLESDTAVTGALEALLPELPAYDALLIGPGLGRSDTAAELLRALLMPDEAARLARGVGFAPDTSAPLSEPGQLPPLVLDADALNLLANMNDWPAMLPPDTVLTPHPAEFGRLARLETNTVQGKRMQLAQEKAAAWDCVVVLKGAFTIVAAPNGRAAVQPFATAALASAGTGDVLAGIITGLLAQGLDPFDAALAGAWLHGKAGELAAAHLRSVNGVMAGDVLDAVPGAIATVETAHS